MLLLSILHDSWSAFITIQGSIANLIFFELTSNIFQEHAICNSKAESSTSAFYIKGKFIEPSSSEPKRFQKTNFSKHKPFIKSNMNFSSQSSIICH
jgi:hypothetical protein